MSLPALLPAVLLALAAPPARAEEGMWPPAELPAAMEGLDGLGLAPARWADVSAAPLGAIVSLGGCTGAFVSADGLVATNHHCVQGALQYLADADHRAPRDGFLARSRDEERWAGPGTRVYVVDRVTDVTDRVRRAVRRGRDDTRRWWAVQRVKNELVDACEERPEGRGPGRWDCRVVAWDGGARWSLVRRRVYRDVRLVYAPPRSVGSFGDEVDNWIWPRHAGDFALLRVYVAPGGEPAEHDPANVPLHPPAHLRVSTEGVREGDLVLVAGYPGATFRNRSAAALRFQLEVAYPLRLELDELFARLLHEAAEADPDAAPRLVAPTGWAENDEKYVRGMLEGLRRHGVLASFEERGRRLDAWLAERATPAERRAVEEWRAIEEEARRDHVPRFFAGRVLAASDHLWAAHLALRLARERDKPDAEREPGLRDRDLPRIEARFRRMEHTTVLAADRALLRAVLERWRARPAEERVPAVDAWIDAHGGVDGAVDALLGAPSLADLDARLAALRADAADLESRDDPLFEFARVLEDWLAAERERARRRAGAQLRLGPVVHRVRVAAGVSTPYPDANGTLRVTWGRVEGYRPRDAVLYEPRTRLAGVVEKAGPPPFDAPARVLDAAARAPASRWADPGLGDVPVDFLSTCDTTRGNSGSPTLDAAGRLVGFLFDGNYEAIDADWAFAPDRTRSIHADVRYLLWMLDEVEGADALLAELLDSAAPAP